MMMDEELAALADGTLAPERRAAVLRRVAADPQLTAALAGQRAALAAIRGAAQEPAPDALRSAVEAMTAQAQARASGGRRRFGGTARSARPLVLAVATATALVAVVAVLFGSGNPAGPSVAEAARVALAPASASAPGVQPGASTLTASIDGVSYPYWADSTGWRAVGARRDVLRGRTIRTVFYASGSRRIGYAIAAGAPLAVDGGRTVTRDGVRMRVLRSGDAAIVTWLRAGHTCVLAATGVDPEVLVRLAAWRA